MTSISENRVTAPAARKSLPVRPDVEARRLERKTEFTRMARLVKAAETRYGKPVEERPVDLYKPTCRRYSPEVWFNEKTKTWWWVVRQVPFTSDARDDTKIVRANGTDPNEKFARMKARFMGETLYDQDTRITLQANSMGSQAKEQSMKWTQA